MVHLRLFAESVALAAVVSLVLSNFGAHGVLDSVVLFLGFPGIWVNFFIYAPAPLKNYVLITSTNALIYLGILESLALISGKRRSP